MSLEKRRVERIPHEWVDDVRRRVHAGREFQDALREVLTALWTAPARRTLAKNPASDAIPAKMPRERSTVHCIILPRSASWVLV
jgi:hypothetical protein